MAGLFDSIEVPSIGTSNIAVYSPTTDGVIMSVILTNKTTGTLPVSCWIQRGADTVKLATDARVLAGRSFDVLQGSKIAIKSGDVVYSKTVLSDGFNCIISAYKDT